MGCTVKLRSAFFGMLVMVMGVGFCQDSTLIDSLQLELSNAESDSARLVWLQRLTWNHIANDSRKASDYNAEARAIAQLNSDSMALAQCHHYDGLISRFLGNYDQSLYHLQRALNYYQRHDRTNAALGALYNLGVVHSFIGEFETSLEFYYRQLRILESLGDSLNIGTTLNSIGSVKRKMGQLNEALSIYKRALEIVEIHGSEWNRANVLSNIGAVYLELKVFDLATEHFQQALSLDRMINDRWGMAYNLHRLGTVASARKDWRVAGSYLEEALALRREMDQKLELAETMIAIGAVWFRIGQRTRGISIINEALIIADSIGAYETKTSAHLELSQLYEDRGEYPQALQHLKKYSQLRDTVLTEEKLRITSDLEARYESAKKDREIAEHKLEIASANSKVQRQDLLIRTGFIGFGAIVIILVLVVIFYNERKKLNDQKLQSLQREKELVALKSVMIGEEKERTRIARDLHDGLSSLLAAIKFQFNSIQEETKPFAAHSRFTEAMQSLDDASKEVRRIAHNMMPEILMKYGLLEALSEFIAHMKSKKVPSIEFSYFGMNERLSPNIELILYRVIQELLNNIVRHSGADEVLLQLNRNDDRMTITVEDNGVGMDLEELENSSGIGMSNLRSRIEYLNGELNIESQPGQGTSVYIEIDLN